ncbi:hypothetical protein [Cereibacter changlensis]|uniref:hypothetical protein n=1 Tax=Cereibacter changlensis TaxID=402884 RepID=UPI0040346FB0
MGEWAEHHDSAQAHEDRADTAREDAAAEQALRDRHQAILDAMDAARIRSPRLGIDPSTRPQNPHDVPGYGWMRQRGD